MKKYLFIVVITVASINLGFSQEMRNSKEALILPKAVTEVGSSGIGGTFAIFTEDGKIYSDKGNTDMHANAMCYGDKVTLEVYAGFDFKKQMEADYNEKYASQRDKSNCCFKAEAYLEGTLVSWKAEYSQIGENTKAYLYALNWKAFKGACVVYLNVNIVSHDPKINESLAKEYLNEMIANAKKTDFTKL